MKEKDYHDKKLKKIDDLHHLMLETPYNEEHLRLGSITEENVQAFIGRLAVFIEEIGPDDAGGYCPGRNDFSLETGRKLYGCCEICERLMDCADDWCPCNQYGCEMAIKYAIERLKQWEVEEEGYERNDSHERGH